LIYFGTRISPSRILCDQPFTRSAVGSATVPYSPAPARRTCRTCAEARPTRLRRVRRLDAATMMSDNLGSGLMCASPLGRMSRCACHLLGGLSPRQTSICGESLFVLTQEPPRRIGPVVPTACMCEVLIFGPFRLVSRSDALPAVDTYRCLQVWRSYAYVKIVVIVGLRPCIISIGSFRFQVHHTQFRFVL
jgi:hypothetical protein